MIKFIKIQIQIQAFKLKHLSLQSFFIDHHVSHRKRNKESKTKEECGGKANDAANQSGTRISRR